MKKFKKLQALLIAMSVTILMLPGTAASANAAETDISAVMVAKGGAGKFEKQESAKLIFDGAEKNFTDDTYLITPYKEIKFWNGNNIENDGPLADYDKIEFYAGLTDDSAEGAAASLVITKWNDKGNGGNTKADYTGSGVTLEAGKAAQKITVSLADYDSMQIIVKNTTASSDYTGTKVADEDTKIIFGNFRAYKTAAAFDRSSFNQRADGIFGGIQQKISGSRVEAVHSGAKYYIEPKFTGIDGSKYSAMEFYLGTSAYTEVEGVEQYAQVRIMTTTDTSYQVNSGVDAWYTIKAGSEPRFVSIPVTSTTQAVKMIWKHGYLNENGAFVQFSESDGYGVTSGTFKLGVFDLRMYKNKNAFVSNRASGWNNLGTQTLGTLSNVGDWWMNGKNFTMGDKKGDILYSDGIYWSQDITQMRNNADSAGSMTVSLVTEGYIDRFTGTFGVAAGQSVAAADTDYIVVKGYNWKNSGARDVNDNFAGTNGSKGTVLYSSYAMPDGFKESFDIDTSSYDYIKIFTNFTGTRRASLMDYAFHQYNAKTVETTFDKTTGVLISSSKQARTSGTMAAVAYNGDTPTAVVYNNEVKMGTNDVAVSGNTVNQVPVIAHYTLDLKDMLDADYIKYYYVESAVTPTLDDLSMLTEENLVNTYALSSNITGVKAIDSITVEQGTSVESLGLPKTVTVTAAGNAEIEGIGVTWNTNAYNPNIIGTYTLTGTISNEDLAAKELKNNNNITASVKVTVKAPSVLTEKSIYGDVKFGGGGFVTGITVHPKNPNLVYARTDVGGAYRYDAANKEWKCITDWLPHFNYYGIDAIAVDPNNENVVYICAGTYWYNAGHGIYKSTDKGETWENISFTSDSRVFSGNSVNRTAGESFAVDPNNSDILYCGTRVGGLWVSKNGGQNWTKTTIPVTETYKTNGGNITGIRSIAIKDNGDTSTVYAGVYDYDDIEGGVYVSTDNGDTWNLIADSPKYPLNMEIAEDGNLYVSSGMAMAVSENAPSSFMKYDGTSWTDLTPSGYQAAGSFDTYKNSENKLVIYLAESGKSSKVYKKTGDGSWETALTWETVKNVTGTSGWFKDSYSALLGKYAYVGDLEISQNNGKVEMWISDGGVGVWHNSNVENNVANFAANVDGIEVTSTTSIAIASGSGSKYKLLSSNHDYGVIATEDVADAAKAVNIKSIGNTWFNQVKDIAICPSDSRYMAFTTSYDGEIMTVTSEDGGNTWKKAADFSAAETAENGKLAIGAAESGKKPAIVILPGVSNSEAYVQYSADFGETWETSQLNDDDFATSAYHDRYNNITAEGNCFYIYDISGKVYTSKDNGETFTENEVLTVATSYDGENSKQGIVPVIAAKPGADGEVWISNKGGLFKSTDYGATFAKVSADVTINNVRGMSFGKGIDESIPSVFVLGNINNVYGLYRSDDNGESWIKLNDSTVTYTIPTTEIAGDMDIHGRVYIATGGRGIMMLDTAETSTAAAVNVTKTENGYKAAIKNYTGNAVIVAASYTGNVMTDVKVGESKAISGNGDLNVSFAPAENSTVKIFIWESVNSAKPLFKAQ